MSIKLQIILEKITILIVQNFCNIGKHVYFSNLEKKLRLAQFDKSRALSKVVETIINIGSFEQQCVILEVLFQCVCSQLE